MRLIDVDALPNYKLMGIMTFEGEKSPAELRIVLWEDIKSMPTISAVPVVRCRECENYGKIGDCQSLDLLICIHSDTINNDFFPDPDFFCAYGKRKEAGHEQ